MPLGELQFVKIESISGSKHKKNIKFYRTEIDIFLTRVESLENISENVCVVPRVRSTAYLTETRSLIFAKQKHNRKKTATILPHFENFRQLLFGFLISRSVAVT